MTVAAIAAILVAATGQGLDIEDAPCAPAPDMPACTVPGPDIYVDRYMLRPISRLEYRQLVLHELGHQADFRLMADHDRAEFMGFNHILGPWRSPGYANPQSGQFEQRQPPFEQWAEAFAFCNLTHSARVSLGYFYDGKKLSGADFGWEPTRYQSRVTCSLVRRLLR